MAALGQERTSTLVIDPAAPMRRSKQLMVDDFIATTPK